MPQKVIKLVVVLATFMSITEKKEKLEWIPCIWYSITSKDQTEVVLNSRNKINIINQTFDSQLGFKIWKTSIRAQKIDDTTLEIYKIVVFTFFMLDKDNKERFLEKNFLLADIKPKIVFEMLFLTTNNADIDFQAWNLE